MDVTFNPTGSLPGTVITDFLGPITSASAVVLQKNGKIVVAGTATGGFAVARYNMDGSLDVTFNPTGSLPGTVITDVSGVDNGFAVAIQKDGKIVMAGAVNQGGAGAFGVVRYNTDASLDVTFNPTGSLPGTVVTDTGGAGVDGGRAVAIQKDGKIVVAGNAGVQSQDFAVVRYVVFKRGVAVRDCIAEENGEDGFNIAGRAYDVRDSAAIHNVLNGFLLESPTSDCQLLNNEALQNGNDGFLLESLTDGCQLLSNEALKNSNIGLENLGTDNQILNNRSHNNVSSNYAGVALVETPTSTTGFWANVEA